MQTLSLPAASTGNPLPSPSAGPSVAQLPLLRIHLRRTPYLHSLSKPVRLTYNNNNVLKNRTSSLAPIASSPISSPFPMDESDKNKLAQVSMRLEKTSRHFKRLGGLGFWGQLVCALVAAVILSFSVAIKWKITSPVTFYATAGGVAAAFISVFWSFGHIRLSDKLRRAANEPSKAPSRAVVVKSLKNGIALNLLGMGAALLGMQATLGLLVAKVLTSSAVPFYQGISPGYSPVLALDVFLVQASANTVLSHFLGLVFSMELLRSVTLPSSDAISSAAVHG